MSPDKYIYQTVRGIVVQVPGEDGKVRTRRVKTLQEARKVRSALLRGLKVVPKGTPKVIPIEPEMKLLERWFLREPIKIS